jgi:hypothetical protein
MLKPEVVNHDGEKENERDLREHVQADANAMDLPVFGRCGRRIFSHCFLGHGLRPMKDDWGTGIARPKSCQRLAVTSTACPRYLQKHGFSLHPYFIRVHQG